MEHVYGVGFLVLIALIVWVTILMGKRRTKALKRLAGTMDFSFLDEFQDKDDEILKSLSHLDLFSPMAKQGAWDFMRRQDGDLSITIMDHRLTSGSSSKPGNVSEQTVIVFRSPSLNLPRFTLRDEDLGFKIATALIGLKDINFDSHPAFSKRFHLHGKDEEAIRNLFNHQVLSYYESKHALLTDGSGDSLVVFRKGKTVAVDDISAFLDQGLNVLRMFEAASAQPS